MASLVPALLMAPRARVCLRVFKYVKAPIDCGAIHQCCLDVDSSCSSAEGNAQRARGKSSVCVFVRERERESWGGSRAVLIGTEDRGQKERVRWEEK